MFGGLLIFLRRGHKQANTLLGVMLLILSTLLLHEFLVESGLILSIPGLAGFTMPLEAFFSPLLFRYIQILTQPETNRTSWQRIKHFIIPSLGGLLSIPFFLLPTDQKMTMLEQAYASTSWIGIIKITFPLQMLIAGSLFTVYLILSFLSLHQHRKSIDGYFSFHEKITLSWVRNLLLTFLGFWIIMAAFYLVIGSAELSNQLLIVVSIFTVFAIIYIGVMGLMQPRIFALKHSRSDAQTPKSIESNEETESELPVAQKYQHSGLGEQDIQRIAEKTTAAMQEMKPYMNSNLTLPELAKVIGVTPNYLSQVINDHFGMNFFDYVNSYRIELAKVYLHSPDNTTATILDIAMAAAFNSKSAFYSAFKKHTGMTPSVYKKSSEPL